jgi:recombination protein RecT
MSNQLTLSDLLKNKNVNENLSTKMTPAKMEAFKISLLEIQKSNSYMFDKIDPMSIISTALIAATLDLPLNQNFGYAYLVPYAGKAQLQMGYKGYIQLAQRSGQYKTISGSRVCQGQIKNYDRLKGMEFDWSVESDEVVGYVAYFKLLNGFESYLYMTNEELEKHAGKYSQSYKSGKGMNIWRDNFEAMATKTVLKLLLSKYGVLSTEMQKAVEADQTTVDNEKSSYIDNNKPINVEVKDEILDFINNEVTNITALQSVKDQLTTDEQKLAYKNKENSFVVDQNPVIAPKPEAKQELTLTQLAQAKYPENEFKDYIQLISDQFGVESLEELSPDEQANQIQLLNLKQ